MTPISRASPLGLAYVAAVTPATWDIRILDENFETCDYPEADLVGITAFTSCITRAYEIAAEYRKRGTKVVLGGIHASMRPDEALRYVDAVVVGEVENIWQKVLDDFEAGRMTGAYKGTQVDLETFDILPRRDLFNPGYIWNSIQTSRGCPFNCSFCSVSHHLGKEYRQRKPESVLRELETIPGKYIFFADDNLVGYSAESRARAIALFDGMISRGMKKRWWTQTSLNVSEDDVVLQKAKESGCAYLFIGFESNRPDMLKVMHKGINLKVGVDNYKTVVSRLHAHGLGVHGSFIIGNDHEGAETYEALAKFIMRAGVDIVQISILTPLPGTDLFNQVEKEGRLLFTNFPADWDKFRFSYMTHRAEGTTPEMVYTGANLIKKGVYTFPFFAFRMIKMFFSLRNPVNAYIVYRLNKALKRSWTNSHYRNMYPSSFKETKKI